MKPAGKILVYQVSWNRNRHSEEKFDTISNFIWHKFDEMWRKLEEITIRSVSISDSGDIAEDTLGRCFQRTAETLPPYYGAQWASYSMKEITISSVHWW